MNILVIGGTEFVGRHIVERAILLGHKVSVFHRGQHGSDLFPEAEHILGDRDGGLAVLGDRKWDVVIDTCGYVPRIVKQSVEALKESCSTYLFISTISVYAGFEEPVKNENAPLAKLKDETTEVIDAETYGGLKVLCENAVTQVFGERALIVRPGMIVGPYDKTDRFTYWFRRAGKGGKMLSVCERDDPAQFIDGRDLATFCLHLLHGGVHGTFNATGPQYSMSWGDIFDESGLLAGTEYEIIRPPLDWLKDKGVETGKAFPAQYPSELNLPGIYRTGIERSLEAGLSFMPLAKTIEDTLTWRNSVAEPLKVGMTPEQEAELLKEYGD